MNSRKPKTIGKSIKGPIKTSSFASILRFIKNNRRILVAIAIFAVLTISFLWPYFIHAGTYSDGGDHMFNAWTLARDQHCILRQGCANYSNGNIFFPHKDTMLYSETQLSTGLLTLPLHFINQNPLFSANVWFILSAFFAAFFMYLLAKYLSGGNEPLSILAGLLFEFAPTRYTSTGHLQSMSIFYLPLIILLLLKYRDTGRKKLLLFFTVACSLLFYASWYQMVFGLIVIGLFIIYLLLTSRKRGWLILAATLVAILTTLPLAKEYVRFSKANNATFSITNQVQFSASVDDYLTPSQETPVGMLYYKLRPHIQKSSHDPDSFSYAGLTLYAILAFCLISVFRKKHKDEDKGKRHMVVLLAFIFVAGVTVSLGPLIKLGFQYIFPYHGMNFVIPAPYIFVDKFLPQLSFMRAIGRASVIALFALICSLAILWTFVGRLRSPRKRLIVTTLIIVFIGLDLLPINLIVKTPFQTIHPYDTSYTIPAVYKYVASHDEVNDIIVLRTKKDYDYAIYPTAQAEDVLWAGYHNKNIFNGYSGYEPPEQRGQLLDFADLHANDVPKLKQLGLRYVLIDKLLSDPNLKLNETAKDIFSQKTYEDSRYALYKI
jgi:hypothetical protein